MIEAALFVGAYLLGAIPVGVLVTRARGIDIFKVGSGNVGATNVSRALGMGPALLVFGLDVLKGFVPALAARLLLDSQEWALGVGMAAVAGHCLSPFLKFRGGRGIATGLGILFGASPIVAVGAFSVFLLSMLLCRWVSLSSLIAVATVPLFGWAAKDSPLMFGFYGALVLFVFYRHRANIGRLIEGTEPKFKFGKDKKDRGSEEKREEEEEDKRKKEFRGGLKTAGSGGRHA